MRARLCEFAQPHAWGGIAIGVVLDASIDNIGAGIALGVGIGLALGIALQISRGDE